MFKLKDNDIILFQGDSITDGNRGRNEDLNHIHGHGYQYILASEMYADNFDKNIEVFNRGTSGNRISDLLERWDKDCLDLNPTVLSILVGVNDLYYNFYNQDSVFTAENYRDIYRIMLDRVLEKNPDTVLVIMEPFFGVSKDTAYNKYMQANINDYALVTKEIAEEYSAVFVPLQDIFNEYTKHTDIFKLLWDGVHPTTGGHQLIVRRWKECVLEKLNNR
ncbi:MAG: SGNH/GDSL hydrolase family protein [Clostridia bacterium]|nr:SGNH/GDSL hydrolase family protein [Clostridia bacterium]